MLNAIRSLPVACQSTRPLYCVAVLVDGLMVCTNAMSGIPSRPPPTPNGLAAAPNVGSCVPRPPLIGEPMSRPCEPPAPTSAQETGFGSPACAQVIGIMWLFAGPSPGNGSKVL